MVDSTHSHEISFSIDVTRLDTDTRSKILIVVATLLVGSFVNTIPQMLLYCIPYFLILFSFRPNWKPMMKKLLPLIPLIFSVPFLYILKKNVYFTVHAGIFVTQWQSSHYAIFLAFRTLLLVILTLALIDSEASFYEIIYALEDLHVPKFITALIFFIFRYVEVLYRDLLIMKDALYNRHYGKSLGFNLHTYRVISYMIGGLLARSLVNAQNIADALIIKNFQGHFPHEPKPFKLKMVLFLLALVVYYTFLIILGSPFHGIVITVLGG